MNVNRLFIAVSALVLSTFVGAQNSCFFYPRDGDEIDVGEGFFLNPEFCNKECECVRSYPDFESGIPLDTTICGCYHEDKTNSELYCLVVGEVGVIPELGKCECVQRDLPTLDCVPYRPTSPPVQAPSVPSSSTTTAPDGQVSDSSRSPASAGGISEPSVSPAAAGGNVPESSPATPTSQSTNRSIWFLLVASFFMLPFVTL
ncbi:hypothetical protein FisN_23Hu143 [Fistulifera solaris]|jgi:hypothetical protein|uniref:VWFC domain-containing protein n=1 Tax=Fistulifera solaris TaxID=1519565 RepID=W0TV94_FISSO|nr:hypothetical protein [Fistulifera solaris]GAX27398.1 hypothetical protein FisN_23Hu143 [Fistulifera solaris]|eukprot:GAX27398.1 hypothetical protein FisN_23Hu143 [Fistulifera solaris]